ncbi:hypothetical protein PO124_10775 [Bacillus licheniformis]|nr:hypothetical protein [Bacillus licheniformis]
MEGTARHVVFFSSPEYLICLAPWFSKEANVLKCLSVGNAISLFEYLFCLSVHCFLRLLLFAGNRFPVMNMLRYLQSPIWSGSIRFFCLPICFICVCDRNFLLCFTAASAFYLKGCPNR